jgi:hypothetical protein
VRKSLSLAVLSIILLSAVITMVYASETFTVPNLSQSSKTIYLGDSDSVSGTVSVSGGSGNDINFYVTDANGKTVLSYSHVTHTDFSFTATWAGSYKMTFDNTFSLLSGKSVTLSYSVQTGILGMSQSTFFGIIGVVAVLAVIGYVLRRLFLKPNVNSIPRSQTASTIIQSTPQTKTERSLCPYCGTQRQNDAAFCRNCGKALP